MEQFRDYEVEESFGRFERAASKGHEESIWIVSVLKGVKMEKSALKEAFAKTEEPLGWHFAGQLLEGRERFDFYKKSAEGGCSWGQRGYGLYFSRGWFVEKDEKVYVEWLEKAANQNNPEAMDRLGHWFRHEGGDKVKAVSYFRAAAELGWTFSMSSLAEMLRDGEGCEKDLRQAAIWGVKGGGFWFWHLLGDTRRALESGATEHLDCDFNQLCYTLGWGVYWYQYGTWDWDHRSDESKAIGSHCLDYYCSCVELQEKSVFTFLLCWNRVVGVKDVGGMVAQIVWEGRATNLLRKVEEKQDGKGGCILF
jgi:hypothetical protein